MSATISVEPAQAAPRQSFRLTVVPSGDAEILFGKAVRIRPTQGSAEAKDAHTYWLIGSRSEQPSGTATYFGPGETLQHTDEGYTPRHQLFFGVPPVATAQRYRLTLSISVVRDEAYGYAPEVLETILTVV